MYVEPSIEVARQTAHLLERVSADVVTSPPGGTRTQRLSPADGGGAPLGAPAPAAPATPGPETEPQRARPRQTGDTGPARAFVRSPSRLPDPLANRRASAGANRWVTGRVDDLARALDGTREHIARLGVSLAGARADLDAARQETARAARQFEELRQELLAAETERRQAVSAAEQSETVRAAAERARADAESRAAQASAQADEARRTARTALTRAQQEQAAREAAFADATQSRQRTAEAVRLAEELRGILAVVSAERDAARAEAERARSRLDQWAAARSVTAPRTPETAAPPARERGTGATADRPGPAPDAWRTQELPSF